MVSEQDRLREEYLQWVEAKSTTFGKSNFDREANIDDILRQNILPQSDLAPNSPLVTFLNWFKTNYDIIDTAILWGSYLKGIETERSFSKPKFQELKGAKIMLGPSDVDALVITNETLKQPVLMKPYIAYDKSFNEIGRVERNVFRDITIIPKDDFQIDYARRKPAGQAYFLCAFFNLGFDLKYSRDMERFFEKARKVFPDYDKISEEHFNKKIQDFRDFAK